MMGIAAYTTIEEFLGKVDYEGGIYDALDYGLDADDLVSNETTDEFRADWSALAAKFEEFNNAQDEFRLKHVIWRD